MSLLFFRPFGANPFPDLTHGYAVGCVLAPRYGCLRIRDLPFDYWRNVSVLSSACCLAISEWIPWRANDIMFASCASSNT